jgi:hypothetical protein
MSTQKDIPSAIFNRAGGSEPQYSGAGLRPSSCLTSASERRKQLHLRYLNKEISNGITPAFRLRLSTASPNTSSDRQLTRSRRFGVNQAICFDNTPLCRSDKRDWHDIAFSSAEKRLSIAPFTSQTIPAGEYSMKGYTQPVQWLLVESQPVRFPHLVTIIRSMAPETQGWRLSKDFSAQVCDTAHESTIKQRAPSACCWLDNTYFFACRFDDVHCMFNLRWLVRSWTVARKRAYLAALLAIPPGTKISRCCARRQVIGSSSVPQRTGTIAVWVLSVSNGA